MQENAAPQGKYCICRSSPITEGAFFMSIKIMSWVWDNSPYEGAALLIHLALADHANDDGVCWPSQTGIAHKARCSARYVRQITSQMINDRLLEIEVSSNGRTNHRYRVIHRNSVPVEP